MTGIPFAKTRWRNWGGIVVIVFAQTRTTATTWTVKRLAQFQTVCILSWLSTRAVPGQSQLSKKCGNFPQETSGKDATSCCLKTWLRHQVQQLAALLHQRWEPANRLCSSSKQNRTHASRTASSCPGKACASCLKRFLMLVPICNGLLYEGICALPEERNLSWNFG